MYDVAVVGAGISGLLSALALSKEGNSVLLLERKNHLGGNLTSYRVGGYKVDTGPHALTALKEGPLPKLMDRYFDVTPKFVPHGEYYVRSRGELIKFPWTVKEWMLFDALPSRDRIQLIQAIARGIAVSVAEKENLNLSVADFLGDTQLSLNTKRFLDMVCYFLSGKDSYKCPAWRILKGGGYMEETRRGIKENFIRFTKLARHNGGVTQFYPKSGLETIVKSIRLSLPREVEIRTGEEVMGISRGKSYFRLTTAGGDYEAKQVVYSGMARKLPQLYEGSLPPEYVDKLRNIEYCTSITIWLGLDGSPYFNYRGSEVGFEKGKPYWAMPTSNFDPSLAPQGKQLVGFSFMAQGEVEEEVERARETIWENFPQLEDKVEMEHIQVLVPEKGSVTVNNSFPSPETPVEGLYLVGTDTSPKSMGVTRASFSVLELLERMGYRGVSSPP